MKTYLTVGAISVLLLALSFIGGCQYHKRTIKPPVETTETITVHDTVLHRIVDSFPFYIKGDVKIVYRDTGTYHIVDTAAILADHFAVHQYDRQWEDSLLHVNLTDYVSENDFVKSEFSYKLLRPQTIINKTYDYSTHYDKYVYFGFSLPVYPFKVNEVNNEHIGNINYLGLEALMAYPKGYFRVAWQPYAETFSLGFGAKIMKFAK